MFKGPLHTSILVHHRCGSRQTLGVVLLWAYLSTWLMATRHPCLHCSGHRLAYILPLRHILPDLAAVVQLDSLYTYLELRPDVCPLQRYRHHTRHLHFGSSYLIYTAPANEQ